MLGSGWSLRIALPATILVAFLLVIACGGSEFSSGAPRADAGPDAAGSGGRSGSGGSSGAAGSGGTVAGEFCDGPEDCTDADPCTVDVCGADSRCAPSTPKCDAAEKCCGGTCAACCDANDCNDGVVCTRDLCFNGACVNTPDDALCTPSEYCSPTDDCRPREVCAAGTTGPCDDDNPCTTDRCESQLCAHDFCAGGSRCCAAGCAQCCNDSQCPSSDPCLKGKCEGGQCRTVPFCPADKQCCRSGSGATCGSCCSASECADSVACTDDACAAGSYTHTPNSSRCATNQVCDPVQGCIQTVECTIDSQCPSQPCQTGRCNAGHCEYLGCAAGTRCCTGVGCRACCQNSDCSDGIACTDDTCQSGTCRSTPNNQNCAPLGPGFRCQPPLGCIQCVDSSECPSTGCSGASCVNNRCVFAGTECPVGQLCCGDKCQTCCNDCDCNFAVSPDNGQFIIPPPPPGCGICVSGFCQPTQYCTC